MVSEFDTFILTFIDFLINCIYHNHINKTDPKGKKMEFIYKGKTYEVVKVNGEWRVYSTDIKATVEELNEVAKELKRLESKS